MGRMSRSKGSRNERDLVQKLKDAGLDAKRVPLSGACDGFKGDVLLVGKRADQNWPLTIECKVRGRGFKFLYDNIPDDGVLAVRRDRDEWLVVERLGDWMERL